MFKKFNSQISLPTDILSFLLVMIGFLFATTVFAQRVSTVDAIGTKQITGNVVTRGSTGPSPTDPQPPIQGDVWLDTTDPSKTIPKIWDGSTWVAIAGSDAGLWEYSGTNAKLKTLSDGSTARTDEKNVFVDDNGNVGVGTTTPYGQLHVADLGDTTVYISADTNNDNENDNPTLLFTQDGDPNTTFIRMKIGIEGYPNNTFTNSLENAGYIGTKHIHMHALQFYTDKTARMTITDDGNIGIGTIYPNNNLTLVGTANKTGGGSWAIYSDRRIKDNIQDYTNGLAEIAQLRPVTYNYNEKSGYDDTSTTYVGIIAQEVEGVLPNTVSELDDTDGSSGIADLKQFDGSEVLWTLVNAVKELKTENEALKSRVEALEWK